MKKQYLCFVIKAYEGAHLDKSFNPSKVDE